MSETNNNPDAGIDRRDIYHDKIEIKDALPEDAQGIADVQQETWLTTYPGEKTKLTAADIPPWKTNSEEQVDHWKQEVENESGNQHVWVVKEGQKVIGYCKAIRTEERNEVESIYILEDYQGRGIGAELISKAFEYIGPEKDIILWVGVDNEPTIRFYEKLGFKKTETPIKKIDFPSGAYIVLMQMVRSPENLDAAK